MRRTLTLLFSFTLATLTLGYAAPRLAEGWKPFSFQGTERFEYKLVTHQRGQKPKESGMILELDKSEQKSDAGAELVKLSYTTQHWVEKDKLQGPNALASFGLAGGMAPSFFFMNPMITGFSEQMDFEVGEKMSLFGAGKVEITAKETVAGVEGFVCKMFGPKAQNEPLQFEWVVNPEVALPLRVLTYQNGELSSEMHLVSYEP